MDYTHTPNKIKTVYVQTKKTESDLSSLNIVKNNYFVTNFKNNVEAIEVDNIVVNSNANTIFSVELNNIDENSITLLKHILIFKIEGVMRTQFSDYIPIYHHVLEETNNKYILHMTIKNPEFGQILPVTAKLLLYISNERQF